jgi:hypothetical protein
MADAAAAAAGSRTLRRSRPSALAGLVPLPDLAVDASCGGDGLCSTSGGTRLMQRVVCSPEFDETTLNSSRLGYEIGMGIRNGKAQACTDRPGPLRRSVECHPRRPGLGGLSARARRPLDLGVAVGGGGPMAIEEGVGNQRRNSGMRL